MVFWVSLIMLWGILNDVVIIWVFLLIWLGKFNGDVGSFDVVYFWNVW